jgi:hypothetical protein
MLTLLLVRQQCRPFLMAVRWFRMGTIQNEEEPDIAVLRYSLDRIPLISLNTLSCCGDNWCCMQFAITALRQQFPVLAGKRVRLGNSHCSAIRRL